MMLAATTALTAEARQAVARLAQAVLAVRPLAGVLERPARVAAASGSITPTMGDAATRLLDRVAARLDAPQLEVCPGLALADLDIFERAISQGLGLELLGEPLLGLPAESLSKGDEIDEIVDEVRRASLSGDCARAEVSSFDGAPLRAYALGKRHDRAVVIASACGMPVELCEPWMRRLAEEHLVVTWESRGLFAATEGFDGLAHDTAAQAADLFAVMDHFGVAGGHLMGMCGGVTIALTAAAIDPERVTSLSLWYGDYNLGPASPRTTHQRDLVDFLAMAGEDRTTAAALRTVFCRSLLSGPVPDLAHLSLYPYAGDELLFRYAKLAGSLMDTDVRPLLDRIAQPALVVTSEDDTKAHPAGSRLAAAGLANATLHVEPHGDHITLFHADPGVTELAARFIARAGDGRSLGP